MRRLAIRLGGTRRATLRDAAWLLVVVAFALATLPAIAAFEVRDASPSALGTVSMDIDPEILDASDDSDGRGWRVGASHASLYQVEGLAADQASARLERSGIVAALAWSQAGQPGARETRCRLALRERPAKRIALGVAVERLDVSLEGEPSAGGWAAGCGVQSSTKMRGVSLTAAIAADRLIQSGSLDPLRVEPSVPVSVQVRAGAAAIAWIDRWESDGIRSPRIAIALALGDAASIRIARGGSPERIGTSISLHLRGIEVAAGRLDLEAGGSVTGFSLVWMGPRVSGGD
ncbi:MAG: hypothetical protein ACRENN_07015 [Candidatus Eiseniibacteriota bacterium]